MGELVAEFLPPDLRTNDRARALCILVGEVLVGLRALGAAPGK